MVRREALILAEPSVLLLLYFCAKEVVFLSKQFYNSYITGKTRINGDKRKKL